MLEKIVSVDQIEIVENNCVQVRTKTAIWEDGKQISGSYHRHVIAPGDNYNNEEERVKKICQIIHTPEVVQAYKEWVTANQPVEV